MPEDYRSEWRLEELYRLNLLSLANVTYFISRDRLIDSAMEPVREMDAPWSTFSKRQKARLNVEANFSGFEHLYVYRNKEALPRFFSVRKIKTFSSGKSVLDAIAEASIQELQSTLFVEENLLPSGFSSKRNYSVVEINLEHYDSDEIRLTVSADGAALLIVGNSFSPYWTSDVDGVKTPIFPAYHAFWGVALPKNAKSVVFRYEPPYR